MSADEKLIDAIVELNEKDALRIAEEKIRSGEDPLVIMKLCRKALVTVGDRYANGEYFLSDMIMSSEIFQEIMKLLEPELKAKAKIVGTIGKVVVGTVKGDVHDIGKNILISMLAANGFEVYDLGVDVPPERFVRKIKEVNPKIVGMSALMTVAWGSMKDTVRAIENAGQRDKVKIIVGGGAVNEEIAKNIGTDAYVESVHEGVRLCKRWVEE